MPVGFVQVIVKAQQLRSSSFFMNALYLMLSTFVAAAGGFVFWVIVARTYDTVAVGLATTLLSVSGLLSLLGLVGFDTTFVRFLATTVRKHEYIHSGLIVVTLASAVLAVGAAVLLPVVLPEFSVLDTPTVYASFVFFTVATALNVVTNAVFLAYKQARYILGINVVSSICKVVLPLIIVSGDATTIFVLAGSAQLVGVVLSLLWMWRLWGYVFAPRLDVAALRLVRKFSLSVHAASVLNLLPPTLLPLIVVYHLAAADAAYFYMAFTIASVLYTIAYASMQSAFAESAHNEADLRRHITQAAKLMAVLLVPAVAFTLLSGRLMLSIFGTEYAHNAATLLQVFALAALPVAAYSALGAIFKTTKQLRAIVGMNVVYATVILAFSYLMVPHLGIVAVGWGWLAGNFAACVVGIVVLAKGPFLKVVRTYGAVSR